MRLRGLPAALPPERGSPGPVEPGSSYVSDRTARVGRSRHPPTHGSRDAREPRARTLRAPARRHGPRCPRTRRTPDRHATPLRSSTRRSNIRARGGAVDRREPRGTTGDCSGRATPGEAPGHRAPPFVGAAHAITRSRARRRPGRHRRAERRRAVRLRARCRVRRTGRGTPCRRPRPGAPGRPRCGATTGRTRRRPRRRT